MSGYAAAADEVVLGPRREISAGVKRLGLLYVWLTVAVSGIVLAEPAPYDVLMVGAIALLPVLGLAPLTRGLALYLSLWALIVAASFVATTQAGKIDPSAAHTTVTLYLALSSVVMAAFVSGRPGKHVRLIMSAYVFAALVAASAALIGYFNLFPGAYDLFTVFGRARGTFKDANVLGAFLVPPLLYAFNALMNSRGFKALLWALAMPILLFGSVLAFSRGAWLNLVIALVAYAYLAFGTAATHRQRLKLLIMVMLGCVFAVGLVAAALTIPQVADLIGQRASFEQSYDLGPEGRFGGQVKAIGLIAAHPLGLGALEFGRSYHPEDVHEVYLSMFLNAGWLGGTLYLALVLMTLWLGFRQVLRDRGGDGTSAVIVAAFLAMAIEGLVIDTDHWRHFYLLMAMIWGMALAAPAGALTQRRREAFARSPG